MINFSPEVAHNYAVRMFPLGLVGERGLKKQLNDLTVCSPRGTSELSSSVPAPPADSTMKVQTLPFTTTAVLSQSDYSSSAFSEDNQKSESLEKGRMLYVNAGLGGVVPLRIGCPSEITVLTLRSALFLDHLPVEDSDRMRFERNQPPFPDREPSLSGNDMVLGTDLVVVVGPVAVQNRGFER